MLETQEEDDLELRTVDMTESGIHGDAVEEEEGGEEDEDEQSVTMSCELLRILQQYLNDNDVKMEVKVRDKDDTPGSGFFMDRERFKTSLSGIFEGPTDLTAVTQFLTNSFLVNNGEIAVAGEDTSEDDGVSSSEMESFRGVLARGMQDAVRYIEREITARHRRQRFRFGLS